LLTGGISCYRKARVARAEPSKTLLTAVVKQGPLVVTVRGSGDIRSVESVKIIPRIKRGVVITYLIPDGTQVSSNDVIARFNTDEMERKIKDIDVNLSDAQNRLLSAQTELEIQVMDNTSNLKKAEQDLESARMTLQKQKEGNEPMDRRNAEVKLQTADSDYTRKQRRYEELKDLVKEGFVTEDEVEEERIQLETSKLSAETAAIEKRLLNDYTIPLNRTASQATMDKAATDLEKCRKQSEALYRTKNQAVEVAQRAVDRVKLDLDAAREELVALEVRAPLFGMVMYGNPDQPWRRGEIEVGANFQPGQVLMTIPDRSAMQAVINIPEADIRNVKVGQQATVTVEALGERTFSGAITKVAEVANSGGGWGTDVKEFKVEVALGNSGDLRPGFSCQCEIVTETVPSAIYLPVHAVFRDGEKFFVYPFGAAAADGRLEVTIGRSSIQYVEIVKGLTPDVRVYLNPPEAPAPKS
jgi:RND family efflux transporter MFP subunit